MTTDKSSEREAFVYWWRHKYSAADLEGIPEHVALNAAWAAWQARAALPQQAQDAPSDDLRELGKWLNEEPNRPIDRSALARVLAWAQVSAPQQAQDIAEASGGAEGGPEEDRIEAAFWRFDARHKGYGQWRQAPMSERDAFKAEMRNALHAEAVRAEMRMVVKGWRKQGPQQAQETSPTEVHSCSYFCDRPACIKAQRDELRDRATSLPPQGAEPDACRRCNGEGTVRSHTTHLGPDDYDFDEQCPQCAGTGSADLKDAINALGFWTHKTDIQRTLIERSAVLRILEARAALAASPAPAPQEPADDGKAAWDHTTWAGEFQRLLDLHWEAATGSRERTRKAVIAHVNLLDNKASLGWKARALYASPAPGELGAVDAAAPASLRGLDTPTRVRFYEHDFYVLSNFSAFSIVWDGRRFDTSEHLYHYLKFNTTALDVADAIFGARSAHEAFKLAERNKGLRRKDWDAVKVELMRDILRLKVEQHEYVRRKLLATGDRELVEDSWRDDFWGWGPNRDGKNMLGCLWMQVRAELMAARESPLTQQAPSESSAQGDGGEKA